MAPKAKTDDGGRGFDALAARSISTTEFAAMVGVSPEALRLRVASGEIPKLGHGRLNLVAAVRGFIAGEEKRLQAAQARAAEAPRGRYNDTRADQIDRRLAREAKGLISREEADLALREVAGIAAAQITALAPVFPQIDPAEFAGAAQRIERACDKASAALLSGDIAQ